MRLGQGSITVVSNTTKRTSKGFVIKMSISKWYVFKINGDE